MHEYMNLRFSLLILVTGMLVSAGSWATSEYDMYRAPATETQTLVLLDLSMKMDCAPGQSIPPQGEIACSYDLNGIPPFSRDAEKSSASRLSVVKKAFASVTQHANNDGYPLGLATYSGEGGVIRVPLRAPAAHRTADFMQSLNNLAASGEASLLGSLLEAGHYLSRQTVVFGRSRQTQASPLHPDLALAAQYENFLPRWRTQTISHPDAVQAGNELLRRDPLCVRLLEQRGAPALLEPVCASEHYAPVSAQRPRYNGPAEPDCAAQEEDTDSRALPQRNLLIIASQDIQQSGGLAYRVADEPIGVWIHRLLIDDPAASGYHDSCRVQPGISEAVIMENCAINLVATLRQRYSITTSVIGLGADSELLSALAAAGGGRYYSVADEFTLAAAIAEVLALGGSGPATPEATISGAPLSGLGTEENDWIFTAQFQPSPHRRWLGNVKRYRLAYPESAPVMLSETRNAGDSREVIGPCRDGSLRCINAAARSAWATSVIPDGAVVARGGAAGQLPPLAERRVWVQLGHRLIPISPAYSAVISELDGDQQRIVARLARQLGWRGTHLVTDAGLGPVVEALAHYNRLAGMDPDNTEYEYLKNLRPAQYPFQHRHQESNTIGATVFGAPVLVNYEATEEGHHDVVWWSSTDGFLRAVDAESGAHIVSLLPEALLDASTLGSRFETGDVIPGLDTRWVVLRHDADANGRIRRAEGDYIYLYGGMRRGGNHLYGWDITEPTAPSLLFDIDSTTSGFAALANTWSTPLLANLWLPGRSQAETVLVMGGGYDNSLDESGQNIREVCTDSPTGCGSAIYFVQAAGREAGKLLWTIDSGTGASMHTRFSDLSAPVAAAVKGLDLDGNGITDILYAIDLNGHVIRVQLPQASGPQEMHVTLLAHLGDQPASSAADNGFFFAPSVALVVSAKGERQVALAIGSGTITQPFLTHDNGQLYLLRDTVDAPTEGHPVPVSPQASDVVRLNASSAHGDLASVYTSRLLVLPTTDVGEKLSHAPVIVDNKAFFSTFVPPDRQADRCRMVSGRHRVWAFDIRSGMPVFNASGEIDEGAPTDYAADANSALTAGGWVPVLNNGRLHLLGSTQSLAAGAYSTQPEKFRWKQILSGAQVRPH